MELLQETYNFHVLEPKCDNVTKSSRFEDGNRRSLSEEDRKDILQPAEVDSFQCRGTVEEWQRCNSSRPYTRNLPGTFRFHHNVTKKGYRALVYSGDDRVIPFLSTQAWVRSLNFSIVEDWRAWHVRGQAAGFTITYSNNMTIATVKGAGHVAPEYKPKECLAMLRPLVLS